MAAEIISKQELAQSRPVSISARKRGSYVTPVISAGRSIPYEEYSHLATKYNKLLNEYTSLRKTNAEYQKALAIMEQKCRDVQLGLREWKGTAEYWMKKSLSLQKIGSEMASMLADIDKIPSNPEDVALSITRASDQPLPDTGHYLQKTRQNLNLIPSSSQTTEVPEEAFEYAAERQSMRLVPPKAVEDDVPVVIKSRCLKRKRNSAPENLLHTRGEQANQDNISTKIIKQEIPSSPVTQLQRSNLITQESTFDLDELGERLKTPRKILLNGLGFVDDKLLQRRSKKPFSQSGVGANPSRTIEALSVWPPLRSKNKICMHGGSVEEAKQLHQNVDAALIKVNDNNESVREILRDLSPNIRSTPHQKSVSDHKPIAAHVLENESVLLHVEDTSAFIQHKVSDQDTKLEKPKSRKNLIALLELAPQEKIILEPELEGASQGIIAACSSLSEHNVPLQQMTKPKPVWPTPSKNSESREEKKTGKRRRSERLSKAADTLKSESKGSVKCSLSGECERLRTKPLADLRLDDFKINPKYHQGRDHAFSEVVRGRNARKCLSGCTKLDCCGRTFQKVIDIGGVPDVLTKRGGLWDETQENFEEGKGIGEENRLLRWYLGEEIKLESLSEEERQKILLSARTKIFADKHGKHRHAFERPSTPPGFWRTDMPSTQEIEFDRGDAMKTELEKKHDRFREAMRPGGKWIFRDEC